MMFSNGIQRTINKAFLDQMPRKDQDEVLQQIYDEGYSVKDISKHLSLNEKTLYGRVDAHRGRGPSLNSQGSSESGFNA